MEVDNCNAFQPKGEDSSDLKGKVDGTHFHPPAVQMDAGKENAFGVENDGTDVDTSQNYPDNMTVEEFLEQECEKMVADVKSHAQGLVERLKSEYNDRKEAFVQALKASNEIVQVEKKKVDKSESFRNDKNYQKSWKMKLRVSDGVYKGQTFELTLELGKACMVGRAKSWQYTKNGLSLSSDEEVSTKHGRIELRQGKDTGNVVVYIDVGSSNGTRWNNNELEELDPQELSAGDILRIGTNVFHIEELGIL